jgi:hypothetical protein
MRIDTVDIHFLFSFVAGLLLSLTSMIYNLQISFPSDFIPSAILETETRSSPRPPLSLSLSLSPDSRTFLDVTFGKMYELAPRAQIVSNVSESASSTSNVCGVRTVRRWQFYGRAHVIRSHGAAIAFPPPPYFKTK